MFNAYVDVIGYLYPKVGCHAVGLEYSDIVHDSGDPIPAQAVLEPLILEVKRLKKWEEIKNYRDDRLEYGGYPTSQGFFIRMPDHGITTKMQINLTQEFY